MIHDKSSAENKSRILHKVPDATSYEVAVKLALQLNKEKKREKSLI